MLAACGDTPAVTEVSELQLQSQGTSYPTLSGWLVNRGEAPITSADVSVTLYDGDNRPLDDVMMQVRDIAPGDSARFERRLDVRADGAKLKYVGVN